MVVHVLLSASELAAEEIRSQIRSGQIKAGERINGDAIARDLGISKTPVRDALQTLRAEGLVEIQARVGAFVRHISPRELSEVYALKSTVEPLAASWAAEHGSEQDKERLEQVMARFETAAAAADTEACVECVDEIHDLIFDMSDSEVMVEVYRVFRARVKRLRHLNLSQEGRLALSVEQHRNIVDAICSGNPTKSAKAMSDHIRNASQAAKKLLAEE